MQNSNYILNSIIWWDARTLDEFFYKMWMYYLLIFVGTFKARLNQLWQIAYTKTGNEEIYER